MWERMESLADFPRGLLQALQGNRETGIQIPPQLAVQPWASD